MTRLSMLRNVPLFAGLSDQELEVLADSLGKHTFGKGMIIFHKDGPASSRVSGATYSRGAYEARSPAES